MSQTLVDAGPLVALLNRRDQHHAWAVEQAGQIARPFLTCEAVIAEAFHLLRRLPQAQAAILEMLGEGALTIPFRLNEEHVQTLALVRRYVNVPMSLADACLVRMSEIVRDSVILTLDSDFRIYRRNRRQRIPLLIPSDA